MKENGFTLKKARIRRHPVKTIMGVDYADDIALLAIKPTKAESLLYSMEQAAGRVGLHVNTDETEYKCFDEKRRYLGSKEWFSEISG